MLYDMVTITAESDMHGEACPVCADRPCVANIYVTNPEGEGDTRHTCENMVCVAHTLAVHHHGDDTPMFEVSTAPMPWVATTLPASDVTALAEAVFGERVA